LELFLFEVSNIDYWVVNCISAGVVLELAGAGQQQAEFFLHPPRHINHFFGALGVPEKCEFAWC
jgi:hypothetical protein